MKKIATLVIATALVAGGAYAADSELAGTSTDTIATELTVPMLVKVSMFDSIDLGTFNYVDNLTGTDDGCVFSNNSGNYTVTMTSSTGAFNLESVAEVEVPVTVSWCTAASGGGSCTALTYNTETSSIAGANTTDPTCASTANVSVKVVAAAADMKVAPATYSANLLVLISPN